MVPPESRLGGGDCLEDGTRSVTPGHRGNLEGVGRDVNPLRGGEFPVSLDRRLND